jgi:hypothetical protein
MDTQELESEVEQLREIVTELETIAADLYSRPLMPYSSSGGSEYVLRLGSGLIPYWASS